MEYGITADEARLRTKQSLEAITIEEPVDTTELIEERIHDIVEEQLESVHIAIERALNEKKGVSNTSYVYESQALPAEYAEAYASLMDEITERVCIELRNEGFSANASPTHTHHTLSPRLDKIPVRLTSIILIGWA